jgi:monovalent cation:H+ antiporter, CPA1 family
MRLDVGAEYVLLFVVATVVAVVARRLRVSYTVALVIAGLVLGAVNLATPIHLTQELLFAVVLPGLVFEAAFNLRGVDLWHNRTTLVLLSVPGLLIATALTAVLVPFTLRTVGADVSLLPVEALVFAALISATDPIAVLSLFRRLGAPARLTLLVEGESLLNDATAIALLLAALAFAANPHLEPGGAVRMVARFIGDLLGGALVGGIVGAAVSLAIARISDPMVEITLTVVAAYGSFAFAQQIGVSGVLATVTAGVLCGSEVVRRGMSPTARVSVGAFWEYGAFSLNSIVFLLIGIEVHTGALIAAWQAVLAAFIAVVASRAIIVSLSAAAVHRTRERIPWPWTIVLTWGGLRGALSMVLALSLPLEFPSRSLIVTMTFGVVTLSILVQGLTMPPLLERLGLTGGPGAKRRQAFELAREDFRAARSALEELDYLNGAGLVPAPIDATLRRRYAPRLLRAEKRLRTSVTALAGAVPDAPASVGGSVAVNGSAAGPDTEERFDESSPIPDTAAMVRRIERYLLDVERDRLGDAARAGAMSGDVYEQLVSELDERRAGLDHL